MLKLWEDGHFRVYCYTLFACYTIIGLFASVWISDEFDGYRLSIITYLTLPCLAVFLVCFLDDIHYWRKWPRVFCYTSATIIVTLLWSHILLLNAIGGSDKQIVSNAYRAMTINTMAHRGAFGWIYQKRW